MAIVADAKLLWSRGFGVRDRKTNVPVDDDTVFEFASVSKTAFAYAAMKACEKGILNLDTPLTKYTSERYLAAIRASTSSRHDTCWHIRPVFRTGVQKAIR
jgi:CubicO group peptidase (beta-lactamase class C family)